MTDNFSQLNQQQLAVLRQAQTELAFSGRFLHHKESGEYLCTACFNRLFLSRHKFDSASGWPSFYQAQAKALKIKDDLSNNLVRQEVICGNCQSHLGHLFTDGPPPSGLRYCINSLALKFRNKKGEIIDG